MTRRFWRDLHKLGVDRRIVGGLTVRRQPTTGGQSYTAVMYFGHASWIALVIFGGMFAMRALSSQRRRQGRRGPPVQRSSFTSADSQGPTGAQTDESRRMDGTTSTGTAPGWFRDPFFKHEQRYWSGTEWTEHVTDDGAPGTDPPPQSPGQHGAA